MSELRYPDLDEGGNLPAEIEYSGDEADFKRLATALAAEGVLLIGASERILRSRMVGLGCPRDFFYVRSDSDYAQPSRRQVR